MRNRLHGLWKANEQPASTLQWSVGVTIGFSAPGSRSNRVRPQSCHVVWSNQSDFRFRHWLFAHSASITKRTFVIVSQKIFWWRCFAPPRPAAPGINCPYSPLSYATVMEYGTLSGYLHTLATPAVPSSIVTRGCRTAMTYDDRDQRTPVHRANERTSEHRNLALFAVRPDIHRNV